MTVYVDDMRVKARVGRINGVWSHLFTDTDDPTELHDFAERLGLKRSWFQHTEGAPWLDHYDVVESKRRRAVEMGAVEVTWIEAAKMTMERADAAHEQA